LESRIVKGIFVIPEDLSPQIQKLIVGMLQVDPTKRLTLVQALQSEVFYAKPQEVQTKIEGKKK